MFTPLVTFVLGNRWLAWIGIGLVLVATYFGWRARERAIGARRIVEELRRQGDAIKARMERAPRAGGDDETAERLEKETF